MRRRQVMRTNTTNNNLIRVNGKTLEDVEEFVYLGSKLSLDGDCHLEINARISKASQAYAMLRSIWRANSLSVHTKLRIFKSNVLSILLYGSNVG